MIERYNEILAEKIRENITDDLEEYTIDSTIGRDIGEFYENIVKEVLKVKVWVCVYEISDGKYQLDFCFGSRMVLSLYSNAWHTADIIQKNILQNIIKPYIKQKLLNKIKDMDEKRKGDKGYVKINILCRKNKRRSVEYHNSREKRQ